MTQFYGAKNMVLVVTGCVAPREVLKNARASMRKIPRGTRAVPVAPSPVKYPSYLRYHECLGTQSDVRVSFLTFGERDPRRSGLELLMRILDDGMSTRLHRRIADDKGLAYEVFAGLDMYEDCGVFDIGASVEHEKTPELIDELLSLVSELRDGVITRDELNKAKRRYLWELRATLDNPEAMAHFYGPNALMDIYETLNVRAPQNRTRAHRRRPRRCTRGLHTRKPQRRSPRRSRRGHRRRRPRHSTRLERLRAAS
jgi:predicted Zn-dependent peptidase